MSPPAPIAGVLETALYVEDMERARAFYERVLGFEAVFGDRRMCAYAVGPGSMLLLFAHGAGSSGVDLPDGGHIPPHDGGGRIHVAFAAAAESLDPWEHHLKSEGIEIEGRNTWPRGGRSLYFRDPDGHMLELATPGLWPGY